MRLVLPVPALPVIINCFNWANRGDDDGADKSLQNSLNRARTWSCSELNINGGVILYGSMGRVRVYG